MGEIVRVCSSGKHSIVVVSPLNLLLIDQVVSMRAVETSAARHTELRLYRHLPLTETMI